MQSAGSVDIVITASDNDTQMEMPRVAIFPLTVLSLLLLPEFTLHLQRSPSDASRWSTTEVSSLHDHIGLELI